MNKLNIIDYYLMFLIEFMVSMVPKSSFLNTKGFFEKLLDFRGDMALELAGNIVLSLCFSH